MGCCISSNKKSPHLPYAPSKPPLVPEPERTHVNNRAPPPCLEVETVKEVVLSETRLPKPLAPKDTTTQMSINHEHSVEATEMTNNHVEESSQVSQVSEIYSISESFSTTTTATTTITTIALTERKEDEAISKLTTRKVNHRSTDTKLLRKCPNAGDISRGAKSPAKRAETSRVMSRSVPGRKTPRNMATTGVKKESGDGTSVRRSRSPASRTTGGVAKRSPGKVSGRQGSKFRLENATKEDVINDSILKEKSESSESLDNPHVSLECFIFL